jgi:hypothetical protein
MYCSTSTAFVMMKKEKTLSVYCHKERWLANIISERRNFAADDHLHGTGSFGVLLNAVSELRYLLNFDSRNNLQVLC